MSRYAVAWKFPNTPNASPSTNPLKTREQTVHTPASRPPANAPKHTQMLLEMIHAAIGGRLAGSACAYVCPRASRSAACCARLTITGMSSSATSGRVRATPYPTTAAASA